MTIRALFYVFTDFVERLIKDSALGRASRKPST